MAEENKRRGGGTFLLALGAIGLGALALSQSVKAQPFRPPVCEANRDEEKISDTPCGINGRGRIRQTRQVLCVNGEEVPLNWENQECVDSDVCIDGTIEREDRVIACGFNERGNQNQSRTRECIGGQWSSWSEWQNIGECIDPDMCQDGFAGVCGLNNRGLRECVDGQWGNCLDTDSCVDGTTESQLCGINGRGVSVRTCNGGIWGQFSPCQDPDVCADGEARCRDGNLEVCPVGQWVVHEGCTQTQQCPEGSMEPFIVTRECDPLTQSCRDTGAVCRELLPFNNCSCFSVGTMVLKSELVGDPLAITVNVTNACDFPLRARVIVTERTLLPNLERQFNIESDTSFEVNIPPGNGEVTFGFPLISRTLQGNSVLVLDFQIFTVENFFAPCRTVELSVPQCQADFHETLELCQGGAELRWQECRDGFIVERERDGGCPISVMLRISIEGIVVDENYLARIGSIIRYEWQSFNAPIGTTAVAYIRMVDNAGRLILEFEAPKELSGDITERLAPPPGDPAYPVRATFGLRLVNNFGVVARSEVTFQITNL